MRESAQATKIEVGRVKSKRSRSRIVSLMESNMASIMCILMGFIGQLIGIGWGGVILGIVFATTSGTICPLLF